MTTTARAISLPRPARVVVAFVVAGLTTAGLAPAAAQAGTITAEPATESVCRLGDCRLTVSSLTFSAKAGERNAVTLVRDGDDYTARDASAPLTAGNGCRQLDPHTARCNLPRAEVFISLGDEDDVLDAAPDRGVTVNGGPGADRLTGGDGADTLYGGAGADALHGGQGDDALTGGFPQLPQSLDADDTLDGGPGRDLADYYLREAPIVADLTAGVAGQAGERDALLAVEDGAAGLGDDLLIGDAGPNRLEGRTGDDELRGGDGADFLRGEEGVDRLLAGAGDDRIDSNEPTAAGACGPGLDVIDSLSSDGEELPGLVHPDCERLNIGYNTGEGASIGARPVGATARHLRFAFTCPRAFKKDCEGYITVRTAGRRPVLLAFGYGSARPGVKRISVRLTRSGRRLLRRSCPLLLMEMTDTTTDGWIVPRRAAGARPLWCAKRFRR